MKATSLTKCDATFDEAQHKYFYDGRELTGVTTLLSKHLFPFKYDGISEEVLNAAAERGKEVHADCQNISIFGLKPNTREGSEYMGLVKEYGLEAVAAEYLVSDYEVVASSIDIIYKGDKPLHYVLADIKTTSRLDTQYLSWQLSLYKYMFLGMNPFAVVDKLIGIWLPRGRYGLPQVVDIPEIPATEVLRLIDAERGGYYYDAPDGQGSEVINDALPKQYADAELALIEIESKRREMELREAELREQLLKAMRDNNVKKWETPNISITRKLAGKRTTFDAKAFMEAMPEVYGQFTRETETKESILIKIKSN